MHSAIVLLRQVGARRWRRRVVFADPPTDEEKDEAQQKGWGQAAAGLCKGDQPWNEKHHSQGQQTDAPSPPGHEAEPLANACDHPNSLQFLSHHSHDGPRPPEPE
jgi:hypothetical protein